MKSLFAVLFAASLSTEEIPLTKVYNDTELISSVTTANLPAQKDQQATNIFHGGALTGTFEPDTGEAQNAEPKEEETVFAVNG